MSNKKDENKMIVPPDGGEWTYEMRNGEVYKGNLIARFDDGVLISPMENVYQAFFVADIKCMWQGAEEPETVKGE
jgi:hypothetical protein